MTYNHLTMAFNSIIFLSLLLVQSDRLRILLLCLEIKKVSKENSSQKKAAQRTWPTLPAFLACQRSATIKNVLLKK